jgi:hypothetical protein
VSQARNTQIESYDPLIIGVDPAGSGNDRTAIIRRRGRRAYNLQIFEKLESMELTGIIHRIIEKERPFRVCIDTGNFGISIYDRLKELGHGPVLVPVNSSTVALDQSKFCERRSEMWGLMKLWLQDDPCEIPNDNALHVDLCCYNYDESEHVDSKGRLKLESKKVMKKRGNRSPDCGDALALTFAVPPSVLREYNNPKPGNKASIVMSNFQRLQGIKL